jgi:hypothetical protein
VENYIITPLGHVAIGEITPLTVVAWIDGLRNTGLGETTIRLILSHLSGIFVFAVEEEIISKSGVHAAYLLPPGLGRARGRMGAHGRDPAQKVRPAVRSRCGLKVENVGSRPILAVQSQSRSFLRHLIRVLIR